MNHPAALPPSQPAPPHPASGSVVYVHYRTGLKLDQEGFEKWKIKRKGWNERSALVYDALISWAKRNEELHVGVTETDKNRADDAARAAFWQFCDHNTRDEDGDGNDRAVYAYRAYCQTLQMRRTGHSIDAAQN
jgi:hypothetical protein